jgi:tetratricopeptide (TPR) repeat protein
MLKKITSVLSGLGEHSKKATTCPFSYARNVQNFLLIWLDTNIDVLNNQDCCNTITQLRQVVNTVNTFTNADRCLDFIVEIKEEKVFMIISGALGEIMVPSIHDMPQIDSIYVFCQNDLRHKQWAQNWPKVKGVFVEILALCEELKHAAQQCDQNAIPISFVSTNDQLLDQSLDQMHQSFMYTQILKEILLTISFNEQSMEDFISYCREQFVDNPTELDNITKLEQEYWNHKPIWWYTSECFLYSMLNRALRTMEVDTIIKMGFFVRDLHQDIESLHNEQYSNHNKRHSFIVYRGQGLCKSNFNQLLQKQNGLLSFNSFLSTSKKQNKALCFAHRSLLNPDLIGILFVMTIDPSLPSTPYASIKNISNYHKEGEILFSMHTVFRIGSIKQIDHDNNRLWQVELILTSDNDPQRRDLTKRIREEISGMTGWQRLGQFLIMIGQFKKAEDLYKVLFHQTHDKGEKAHLYHHLGVIKDGQGDYEMAIKFYEKSLEINRHILSPDHHYLASSYTAIGMVYLKIGKYSKALSLHKTALEIFQKSPLSHNRLIAICHGNIGKVYDELGEYTRALSSHEKALEIFQEILPSTHPHMASCYYDIGKVHNKMSEFSKALSSHEKALEIRKKILPSSHPLLAASYNSVGELYVKIGELSKGIPCIEHAVDLGQRALPDNHPDLILYKMSLQRLQTIC